MQILSYRTEIILSNRNRKVLSFRDIPRKPLGQQLSSGRVGASALCDDRPSDRSQTSPTLPVSPPKLCKFNEGDDVGEEASKNW